MAPRMAGVLDDVRQTAERYGDKPRRRNRPEPRRHGSGAVALNGEQAKQDDKADRQDEWLEGGCHKHQAFHGRQHRDCRRDDCVTVKKRCPHHAEKGDERHLVAHRSLHQGHQAQGAALAIVVHPHDQHHVFEGHDDDQRPQHQRHHAEHHLSGQGASAFGGDQAFLERVEGARSNIAVDDTDGTERQRPETGRARPRRFAGSAVNVRGRSSRDCHSGGHLNPAALHTGM